MAFPQEQVAWLLANRGKIFRYAFIPQLLAAVVLLDVAYVTGKTDIHLLLSGARTEGRIVGFQMRKFYQKNPNSISTGTHGYNVYLPIVEFEAQGSLARFEEHKLMPGGEGVGWSVPVLYDPSNPSVAMIDRSYWNWLPWGPALGIGLVVGLASLKGFFVFLFVAPRSPAVTGA
jgi:hypothetical protein